MAETTRALMRRLRAAVAAIPGAKLVAEPSGVWTVYQAESPDGMVWAATGDTHCLRIEWKTGESEYAAVSLTDAIDRVSLGVLPCNDPECDYCHD